MKKYWFAVFVVVISREYIFSTTTSVTNVNIAVESDHEHFPFAKAAAAAWEKLAKKYPDKDITSDNSNLILMDHGTLDEGEYHAMINI